MLCKLAFRNVKRQIGNELIYFMTVAITVAFMFAIDQVLFNQTLYDYAVGRDLQGGMIGLIVLISAVVAFMLSYASAFMLRLRRREFGVYLTCGMTRVDVLRLFLTENLLICIVALAVGMLFGLFLYQGLMGMVSMMLEAEFTAASYSVKGTWFTIVLVFLVFLVSCLLAARYLYRVTIHELVKGRQTRVKSVRFPFVWTVLTIGGAAGMAAAVIGMRSWVRAYLSGASTMLPLLERLFLLFGSLILFHFSLAHSLMALLLKRKRLRSRGTNTFLFRQLSASLHTNAAMMGMIACLLAIAVIGLDAVFMERLGAEARLAVFCPYDLHYIISYDQDDRSGRPGLEEAKEIVERYTAIEKTISYTFYADGGHALYDHTQFSGEGYAGIQDSYVAVSEFNALITPLGYDAVELSDSFLVVADVSAAAQFHDQGMTITLNGREYHMAGVRTDYPDFMFRYLYAVVPDEAVEGMAAQQYHEVYELKKNDFDAHALERDLSYAVEYGGRQSDSSDFIIKEYERREENARVAFLSVSAMFAAGVLLCMGMALLALKTLTGLAEDKERYRVLSLIGVGMRDLRRVLFRQTFFFFIFPLILPLVCGIPAAALCQEILRINHMELFVHAAGVTAFAVSGVILLLYLLYYSAAYLIAKRVVVWEQ